MYVRTGIGSLTASEIGCAEWCGANSGKLPAGSTCVPNAGACNDPRFVLGYFDTDYGAQCANKCVTRIVPDSSGAPAQPVVSPQPGTVPAPATTGSVAAQPRYGVQVPWIWVFTAVAAGAFWLSLRHRG